MKPQNKRELTWIRSDLIESKAWLSLQKPSSFKVLLRFLQKTRVENRNMNHKRKKFVPIRDSDGDIKIENNGKIEFCYSEAKNRLGLAPATFAAALDELIEKGFIDIAQSGYGFRRIKTLFSISKRWKAYGTDEFIIAERPKRPINGGFRKKKKKISTTEG